MTALTKSEAVAIALTCQEGIVDSGLGHLVSDEVRSLEARGLLRTFVRCDLEGAQTDARPTEAGLRALRAVIRK